MHKNKNSLTQSKSKPKMNLPNPTPKKSLGKSKDKVNSHSPRNQRIHTLESKTNIDANRKLQIRL